MTSAAEKKIIIIEDEPRLLDLYLFNLGEQYRVEGYSNAEDFLEKICPR